MITYSELYLILTSTLFPQENVKLWQEVQDAADEEHQTVFFWAASTCGDTARYIPLIQLQPSEGLLPGDSQHRQGHRARFTHV